jgi:mannose-1-phosphate guanylyltransferase
VGFATSSISNRITKAFVLGAGLGTRLQPLTRVLPKPLLPIFGKPLITFAFDHLLSVGIDNFIVNTHHLSGEFSELFESEVYENATIDLVYEPIRLETGGGMKNIESKIGDEIFVVYSGDILTDIPIESLLDEHLTKNNDVTIALRNTGFSSVISWSPDSSRVVDILGELDSSVPGQYDFAGLSVWNPSVFGRLPENESFSFIRTLIEWMRTGGAIGGVVMQSNNWFNIGSRREYLDVHRVIGHGKWIPNYLSGRASYSSIHSEWPTNIDPSASIIGSDRIDAASYVGPGCNVGKDVELRNSVLFAGSSISAETRLDSCVVAGVSVPSGIYAENDFV